MRLSGYISRIKREPHFEQRLYVLFVSLGYALLCFLPLASANVDFVNRTEMPLRFDLWWLALPYFGVVGILLGRLCIWTYGQSENQSLQENTFYGLLIFGAVLGTSYLAQMLLNPAYSCMLENCFSSFMLIYLRDTLLYTGLLCIVGIRPSGWLGCIMLLVGLAGTGFFLYVSLVSRQHSC
jgi:hypothetical protein